MKDTSAVFYATMSRVAASFVIGLALVMSGCMSMEHHISLRADGSGTVTERFELNPVATEMMQGMAQGMASSESDEEHPPLFSEADAQERADMQPGLSLISVTLLEDAGGGTSGYEAVYGFDDINQITAGINLDQAAPDEMASNLPAEEGSGSLLSDMDLTFTPGSPAELLLRMPPEDKQAEEKLHAMPEATPAENEEMAFMMQQMMQGVRIVVSIEVEGTILDTNASLRDGNRIVLFDLDFERLLEEDSEEAISFVNRAMNDEGGSLSAEQLNSIPGFSAETSREVLIRFE